MPKSEEELLKTHLPRIYWIYRCMAEKSTPSLESLANLFHSISHDYLKESGYTRGSESFTLLYQIACHHIFQESRQNLVLTSSGRDFRKLRELEENLLGSEEIAAERLSYEEGISPWYEKFIDRLQQVDSELRIVLVLKDILGMEEDDILSIVRIRWAIYRHRLHRGRLELKEALEGTRRQVKGAANKGKSPNSAEKISP